MLRAIVICRLSVLTGNPRKKKDVRVASGLSLTHVKETLSVVSSVSKAVGFPPLEGAAEIVKRIVEIVENMGQNKKDCISIPQNIAKFLQDIAEIVQRGSRNKDKLLMKSVQEVENELQTVAKNLEEISERSKIKRFWHATEDGDTIKKCEKIINDCIVKFTAKAAANNWNASEELKQGQENIKKGQEAIKQGQEVMQRALANIAKVHDESSITYDDLERATPSLSKVFFGRDELVAEGVKCLMGTDQTFLAILGAGGIGKTSIALHVNNAQEVKEKYAQASYFLPCEVLPDAKSLLQGLTRRLDIEVKEGESQHKKLEGHLRIHTEPVLFILDNFDTPWNNDQVDVESLLEKLAAFNQISMILTMRGLNGPGAIEWKRLGSASIPPLALESARKVFLTIAGMGELEQENPIIEQILKELDCVPLAITLIAKRAKSVPLESLLRMWQDSKTAMLTQGKADGRLTSVDHSIGLSTRLLNPLEVELLAIISFLPDGVPDWVTNLSQMLAGFERLDQSINTLLEYSLVYSQNLTIKVLAPIREYICMDSSIDITRDIPLIESFYILLLTALSGPLRGRQNQIEPQLMNITKILIEQTKYSPKKHHVEAMNILLDFTKLYPTTVDILENILNNCSELGEQDRVLLQFHRLYMLRWMAKWQEVETEAQRMMINVQNNVRYSAKVLKELGYSYYLQARYDEASGKYTVAKTQFEQIGDQRGVAECMESLGKMLLMQEKYNEAAEMLNKAKDQFEKISDLWGVAQCLQRLADINYMQGKYSEAAEMVNRAKTEFEQNEDQLGAVQCLQSLGKIYQMQGKYSEAAEMLNRAKDEFEQIGNWRGVAQCLRSMGNIKRVQAKYTEAIEMLNRAKYQLEDIGDQLGVAQCLQSLGDIHRMQAKYSEAVKMLNLAKNGFEQIQSQSGLAQCLKTLGEIHFVQAKYSEAAEMMNRAKDQFEQIGNQLRVAQCIQKLGEIHCLQRKYSEAAEMLNRAKDKFEQIGDQYGASDIVYRLATLYRKQGLYQDAKTALEVAISKFKDIGNVSWDIGYCLYEYGLLLQDETKYADARKKFEEARDTFASHGELQDKVEMCDKKLAKLDELEKSVGNDV
ncbi:hypothetical protein D9758_018918 [Tetrapyrgos nigripes]|uniref:Novel STAND NTPase 1 domain-containing protein n=1 Tax=Tetrapyrgos nigripes TaxID=182062 RepID=A0A8H5BRZ8_9AGAR|nr:hypothetical protein D9758_018918 [Tetrapyrgos nigripes]